MRGVVGNISDSLPYFMTVVGHVGCCDDILPSLLVVVVDLPLPRVAVEGSDNPITLEQPCKAYLPPDQQRHHSLGRHPKVQDIS